MFSVGFYTPQPVQNISMQVYRGEYFSSLLSVPALGWNVKSGSTFRKCSTASELCNVTSAPHCTVCRLSQAIRILCIICLHKGCQCQSLSTLWDSDLGKLHSVELPRSMNLVSSSIDHTGLRMNVFLFSPLFKNMCLVTKASICCVNLEIYVNMCIYT